MSPTFFPTPSDFRKWLEKNHQQETELLVGFYKKASGKPSITWPESVDQALCFGWIDGIRRSINEESYSVRFTPRRPKSIWSPVNIKKVGELTKLGLMLPAGLEIFSMREEKLSELYSFREKEVTLGKDYERIFRANKTAWRNFSKMIPSYKKPAIWWVISAKQEVTRLKRLTTLIEDSAANIKIKQLRR
ncbi:MAG: YdeI/OmpD-associated family protein [Imperialibacter sp.]|uniref:YdeI/OmpD-associated family protein n=1 Tax=Imperialibacter sp. TaxID=2038411 RepID=UPI0032EE4B25